VTFALLFINNMLNYLCHLPEAILNDHIFHKKTTAKNEVAKRPKPTKLGD